MLDLLARRAVTSGTLGAVAAGSRTAASIGVQTLLDGGNAFDAVVAAALAETVALPSKCGLAGDLIALFVRAGDPEPTSLIALGGAAAGLYDAAAARNWDVPATGALAVGVPGAPAGYARLAELGRFGRERLASPAAALAVRGAIWSPMNALLTAESSALLRHYQPDGCAYDPPGRPHAVGDVVALPGLARLLREWSDFGAGLFSDPAAPAGAAILETVDRHGGVLRAEDLAAVSLLEEPAHHVRTGGGELFATNHPTYGRALTAAFADRSPESVGPAEVLGALDALRAGELGPLPAAQEGTSTLGAADAAGNAVVVIHSNSFPRYGSGLVVPGYDLVLSNRAGRGFAFVPDHPNSPVPGRRPLTTLHGWGTPTADGGWLLGATPGGEQQVPWNAQLLRGLLRADSPYDATQLGEALVGGRWEFPGGQTMTSSTILHEGEDVPTLGARCSHVLVRSGGPALLAGADPRWDGSAVAA
jgi:gamma-glutamyltranspeptidase / glutathione hydrolase